MQKVESATTIFVAADEYICCPRWIYSLAPMNIFVGTNKFSSPPTNTLVAKYIQPILVTYRSNVGAISYKISVGCQNATFLRLIADIGQGYRSDIGGKSLCRTRYWQYIGNILAECLYVVDILGTYRANLLSFERISVEYWFNIFASYIILATYRAHVLCFERILVEYWFNIFVSYVILARYRLNVTISFKHWAYIGKSIISTWWDIVLILNQYMGNIEREYWPDNGYITIVTLSRLHWLIYIKYINITIKIYVRYNIFHTPHNKHIIIEGVVSKAADTILVLMLL